MNLNDGGIAYDAWINADPAYWDDESTDVEPFELYEQFTFGGLTYLLTGEYSGDNLENASLYLLTHWGAIEQDWGDADFITENGLRWDRATNAVESLTDRCYGIADAAYEAATEAA